MTLFPVFVDVYHNEQLVTKEEAVGFGVRKWTKIAVTKDSVTATRVADILDKHGSNDYARRIRGECVYSSLCV